MLRSWTWVGSHAIVWKFAPHRQSERHWLRDLYLDGPRSDRRPDIAVGPVRANTGHSASADYELTYPGLCASNVIIAGLKGHHMPLQPRAQAVAALRQITSGMRAAQALYVAAKLNVADHLAQGPLDAEELSRATEVDTAALGRVMRALCSLQVFAESPTGKFSLTSSLPESGIFAASARDFPRIRPSFGEIGSTETGRRIAKARPWRAFLPM